MALLGVGAILLDVDQVVDQVDSTGGHTEGDKGAQHAEERLGTGGAPELPEPLFGEGDGGKDEAIFDPLARAHGAKELLHGTRPGCCSDYGLFG